MPMAMASMNWLFLPRISCAWLLPTGSTSRFGRSPWAPRASTNHWGSCLVAKRLPSLAVARDASDNSVLGFDAATGRRVWSCPGVIFRGDGVYFVPRQVALLDEEATTSPHVYYSYGAVSRCRQAVPTPTLESERAANASSVVSIAKDRRAQRGTSFAPSIHSDRPR